MEKKELLVADPDELYDCDVKRKMRDIAVRFESLKMKEYADENIYAMYEKLQLFSLCVNMYGHICIFTGIGDRRLA